MHVEAMNSRLRRFWQQTRTLASPAFSLGTERSRSVEASVDTSGKLVRWCRGSNMRAETIPIFAERSAGPVGIQPLCRLARAKSSLVTHGISAWDCGRKSCPVGELMGNRTSAYRASLNTTWSSASSGSDSRRPGESCRPDRRRLRRSRSASRRRRLRGSKASSRS
jgi:hypothetical protein